MATAMRTTVFASFATRHAPSPSAASMKKTSGIAEAVAFLPVPKGKSVRAMEPA